MVIFHSKLLVITRGYTKCRKPFRNRLMSGLDQEMPGNKINGNPMNQVAFGAKQRCQSAGYPKLWRFIDEEDLVMVRKLMKTMEQ